MERTTEHRKTLSTLEDIETMGYIQCVTCGKVIGHLYEKGKELRKANFTEVQIYEIFGLNRTCCRYHFSSGFKLPTVKYLDEYVRLDLDEEEFPNEGENRENLDKVNSIKNRLSKLKSQPSVERTNVRRIPFFVAT
jgi:DNA-directed RNA polymerase subunit N (RpoN/RPB10)